ncbi:unnamed protein product [Lepidochelys kempii]
MVCELDRDVVLQISVGNFFLDVIDRSRLRAISCCILLSLDCCPLLFALVMKTRESGMTIFRLLTKKGGWVWVQANARLVYKGGQPDCIISRQRALSNEEGEEHLCKRSLQLPFHFAMGEAVLYENNPPGFLDSLHTKKVSKAKRDTPVGQGSIDSNLLLGAMMNQDKSVYISHADNMPQFSLADIVDVLEEPWLDYGNKRTVKENDSLLAVIETLFEKSNVDGDISKTLQSLEMDDLELKQWEEILRKMDTKEPVAQAFQERLNDEQSHQNEENASVEFTPTITKDCVGFSKY